MKCRLGSLPLLSIMGAALCLFVACGESESSTNANGTGEVPVESSPSANPDAGDGQPTGGNQPAGENSAAIADSIAREQESVEFSKGFDNCQFNFGSAWTEEDEDKYFAEGAVSKRLRGMDYISVWLGDNDYYNGFEEHMVETCYNIGATPMIYAYVIAEYGKDQGLVDCDVSAAKTQKSHCTDGANIIREHFGDILARYEAYAKGMKEQLEFAYKNKEIQVTPDEFETIWLIEPDFYQYSESGSNQKYAYDSVAQVGGGIPDKDMAKYFDMIVDVIHSYMPNAKIAIDLSPWVEDLEGWYSNFDWTRIDYVGTSGGRTLAGSTKIKGGNPATWAGVYGMTGKPILADAGYGAGGTGEGHAVIWDVVSNINARMADGVAGVMQMDPAMDYNLRIQDIRSQLNVSFPWCTQ